MPIKSRKHLQSFRLSDRELTDLKMLANAENLKPTEMIRQLIFRAAQVKKSQSEAA